MAQQQLPEFKGGVKVAGGVSVPSFQGVTSQIAAIPSTLGEIGSRMAMGAAVQMAENRGYELGQTPQGDLLPPITTVDKAFVNAYTSQAQATLGLQAHKMMQEGQLELAKANKLTPDLISSYEENMAQGLEDILQNAPSNLRPSLSSQFGNQLLQSSGQLNLKLIKQQKQEETERLNLYNSQQTQNIFSYGLSNNFDAAKEALEDFVSRTKAGREAGTLSATQAESQIHAAQLSYYTGVYARQAVDAKNDKKEEQFFRNFAQLSEKPNDVTFSDWEQIQKNVLGYMANLDNLEKRDNNLILSQLNRTLNETGEIPPSLLAEAEEKLDPTTFNNFKAQYAKTMRSKLAKQASSFEAQQGWSDPSVFSQLSKDAVNKAYTDSVDAALQKNPDADPWEVKTAAAMSAAGPVPAYINELSARLESVNPADIEAGAAAYEKLNEAHGSNLRTLSNNAKAMYHAYKGQIRTGRTPDQAAEEAQTIVYGKTPEQHEANDFGWNTYRRDNLSNFQQKLSFAQSVADIPSTKVRNPALLAQHASIMMENNSKLLNLDYDQAKEKTKLGFKQNWGLTYVNGEKEYTYLPLENIIGLPDNSTGVIQASIAEQADIQLQEAKKLYDKGLSPYYYEIEKRTSLAEARAWGEEFSELKKRPQNDFAKDSNLVKRYRELQSKLNQFHKGEPLKIKQRWKDGHSVDYELAVAPSSNIAVTQDTSNPVIGDYDILLKSGERAIPLNGLDALGRSFVYRPNVNSIRQDWAAITGFMPDAGETVEAKIQRFIDKKTKKPKQGEPRLTGFAFIPTL